MKFKSILVILFAFITNAPGLIIYDSVNTTAPLDNPFWDNVTSFSGASGIYLGQGWMVTANHVGTPSNVTLAGQTYSVAAGTKQQIASRDVQIFRLAGWEAITLPEVNVTQGWIYHPDSSNAIEGLGAMSTIGTGVGKGAATTGGWLWNNTQQKQWGVVDTVNTIGTTETLIHEFNRGLGANAAMPTMGDSGSGVFYQDASGWHLAGITTNVYQAGKAQYDHNPYTPGDQPDYAISQRLAGMIGAEIYKTTGVWGLDPNTTASYDGTTWTGGTPATAIRYILSENASFSTNSAALIDSYGTPTTQADDIGTLVLRQNSVTTITGTGTTSIQAITSENGAKLVFNNTTATIQSGITSKLEIEVQNSDVSLDLSTKTLTLNGGILTYQDGTVGTLNVVTPTTIKNQDMTSMWTLGGTEVQSYHSMKVTDVVNINQGATLSTINFRPQINCDLNVEGTLHIEGPGTVTLYADQTTIAIDAEIAFNLGYSEGYTNFGIENHYRFATAQILGTGTLLLQGTLNILNSNLANPNSTYKLFTSNREDAFAVNFSNIAQDGILYTDYGSFQIGKTWDGTTSMVTASNFAAIPEPTTAMLVLGAILTLNLKRRFLA